MPGLKGLFFSSNMDYCRGFRFLSSTSIYVEIDNSVEKNSNTLFLNNSFSQSHNATEFH